MKQGDFELLSVEEMRAKYGLTAENKPTIKLNPEGVPSQLRHLIPYAELWGVKDDLIRDDMVRKAPREAIQALKQVVRDNEDALEDWLAGPEAKGSTFSEEYAAFAAMLMAADFA